MISDTLTTDEHVSLIEMVFSDDNEGKRVRNVSGDNAQAFIDLIDEASLCTLPPQKSRLPLKFLHPAG